MSTELETPKVAAKPEKISGIYKIINKVNGKYYVGSSGRVLDRWATHKRDLRKNRHDNSHLQFAWNKYGEVNFEFVVAESVDITFQNLLDVEQKYLDIAKLDGLAYNMTLIAGKIEMTVEIRKKMSAAREGKYYGKNNSAYKEIDPEVTERLKLAWINCGKRGMEQYGKTVGVGMAVIRRFMKDFKNDTISYNLYKQNLLDKRRRIFLDNDKLILHGENNNRYNNTIHSLIHKITKETFTGTSYEFCKKFGFQLHNDFIHGKRKSSHQWKLLSF